MVISLAPFRFDVTPPLGHPLLGGLVPAMIASDDALEAIGYVLLGAGAPIVVCAVDWAGLLNDAHLAWRTALAEATGTTVDRVSVHCVHQHAAPFVCPRTQALVAAQPDLPATCDLSFFETCLARARAAVATALPQAARVTHLAHGTAEVECVASNRRIARDELGRVVAMRASICTEPELRALPEGAIDPTLQTVVFYGAGGRRIVACHYYATHPMSYYRDGRVSSDFCGLARKRRQVEDPGCTHLYFTGCAGDVAAGKYNDGTPASRVRLTARIHAAMLSAEAKLEPAPLAAVRWQADTVLPPPPAAPSAAELEALLGDGRHPCVTRLIAAFRLAWLHRFSLGLRLPLARLELNDLSLLHLPGEMFVAYQLRARALRPGRAVAVAAYGDGGPWYIPPKAEYPANGYEVSHAFCRDDVDAIVMGAIERLLA